MDGRHPQRIDEATGDTMDVEGTMALSLASLRLSNPQQQSSRENTPVRVSIESLSRRPRSNPRSRTPMRYESPLDPGEFRRESLVSDESSPANEGRRVTIRPLAGSAIGTTVTHRIIEERPGTTKSRKQGPSCRKIRRWNNDKFSSLAAEIKASSASGGAAAEAMLRAQDEAHLYRAHYDPLEHRSETLSRFMQDDSLKSVRERFFECEIPGMATAPARSRRASPNGPLTAQDMMNRVDGRLRKIVVKACTNSYPAAKVVEAFEAFLIASFAGKKPKQLPSDWSEDLLLEPPTITLRKDLRHVAQFFFDAESSTGGFHRLLLHAVCQFHGLNAVSKMVDITIGDKSKARALNVTGTITEDNYRLLDHATKEDATSQ